MSTLRQEGNDRMETSATSDTPEQQNVSFTNNETAASVDKIPASVVASLSADYAPLALLFAQLDQQVETFTRNMDEAVNQAPAYSSLATLWEEQAKAAVESTSLFDTKLPAVEYAANSDAEVAILGDEAENTNDELNFI